MSPSHYPSLCLLLYLVFITLGAVVVLPLLHPVSSHISCFLVLPGHYFLHGFLQDAAKIRAAALLSAPGLVLVFLIILLGKGGAEHKPFSYNKLHHYASWFLSIKHT